MTEIRAKGAPIRANSSVVVTAESCNDYFGRVGRAVVVHPSRTCPSLEVVHVRFPEHQSPLESTMFFSNEVAPEAVAGPYAIHAGPVTGGES